MTGVCVCNISGWGGTAEFSVLGWDHLVCDYNIPLAHGIAVMGVLVNILALLVQSYVTSDRREFTRTMQAFFGFACGLALSVQRLAVPFPRPLMGTDPLHTAFMASYTSCLIGTVLTFLHRFAAAIHKSSMSALARRGSASAQNSSLSRPNLSLPRQLMATQQFTHVGVHASTVCSFFYGINERVWTAGYYCYLLTCMFAASIILFINVYTTGHMIRDLEQFLRVEEELHHEANEAVILTRRRRIVRNIAKLRFLQKFAGGFFALVALSSCCAVISVPLLYAMKYAALCMLHGAVLGISTTTLMYYCGGLRHVRRKRKIASRTSSIAPTASIAPTSSSVWSMREKGAVDEHIH